VIGSSDRIHPARTEAVPDATIEDETAVGADDRPDPAPRPSRAGGLARLGRPRRPGTGGLLRSSAVVSVGVGLSRVTGLARTAVLAAVLGTTALADGYNLANSTPNVIYDLMLGGVLAATLIPVIVDRMEHDDQRSLDAIATYVIAALVGVTALGIALSPLIIRAYTIFKGDRAAADAQISIAVPLLVMFMPQVLLYGLDTLFTALLNAKRSFAAPAFAPVLNNVVVICVLLAFQRVAGGDLSIDAVLDDRVAMVLLGLGTTAGIVALVAVLLPAMARAHIRIRPNFDHRNPALRSVVKLSGWMVGYVVANQVSLWLMKALVNGTGEGRASGFEYAWQFFQLPYGLIAVAVMTAFMPELSSLAGRGDRPGYRRRLGQGYRLAMVVVIPVTVAYVTLATPAIELLLKELLGTVIDTAFTDSSVGLTASMLTWLAIGLPFFVTFLFMMRGFYAMRDTRTPFRISVVQNAVQIVLSLVFTALIGFQGALLGFALGYVVGAVLAMGGLARKAGGMGPAVGRALGRYLVAAAFMAPMTWGVAQVIGSGGFWHTALQLVVAAGAGGAVYVVVLWLLDADDMALLGQLRGRGAVGPAEATASEASLGG
jgi:putative peptidoglycan lipid II flippase